MSSKVTIRQSKGVGVVGLLALIAGVVLIVAGGITWWTVADKLADEDITVSEDAAFLAGKKVNDPFSAFAQADVINKHALEMSDGQTYAELDQDDPTRDTVMNASFLRASLFTSVVSFGIAALVMGLGVLFVLVGWALRRLAGGPPVVVETTSTPGAHSAGAPEVTSASTSSRSSEKADAKKATEPGSRRTSTSPATSATPVVGPATTAAATSAPASSPASSTAPAQPASTTPVSTTPDQPIRMSRSERVNGAAASPAPAGVRPGSTPSVGSELPAGPKGDARLEELEGTTPAGWASPADRVPPAEGKPDTGSTPQP